jgi:cyclopropane-fatty-acyl-phospholipid synthase
MKKLDVVVTHPPRVPWRYRLAAKLVIASLQRWSAGVLQLTLPDGRERTLGAAADSSPVRVHITDWRFFWRVLTAGDIGAGESYMAGEWTCSDLPELCRRFLHDQTVVRYRSPWTIPARLRHALQWRRQANSLAGSRRNIRYHYDLSNDLYRLFLDESMMYSCAVFTRDDLSLEEAQAQKLDAICRRLELAPGMEILEIGCGWGAFAIHAARHYGCRVTGLTLSAEQLALAQQRVAAAGLQALVDLRLTDYRQIGGQFDRIVSIEMFEAVGYEYYGAYFGTCGRLLKPGGRMFLQTISVPDQRFDTYRRDFDWIKKYIFPGGLLASLHAIADSLKQQTDLRIEWMQDIGLHYARTLNCWRQRFMSRLPEVQRLGFDECFIRMWEFYLASCEAAFSVRYIGDLQMVLAKPAWGVVQKPG